MERRSLINSFQIWSQLVILRQDEVTRIAARHQSLDSSAFHVSLLLLWPGGIKVTSKEPAPTISFQGMISLRTIPVNQHLNSIAAWAITSAAVSSGICPRFSVS
jgi:hypothetical protein